MQKSKNNIKTWSQLVGWPKLAVIGWLVLALGANLAKPAVAYTLPRPQCNDVEFIFARGSGETLGDVSYQAWRSSIAAAMAETRGLKYEFYELGSQSYGGHQYPAVSVSGDALGIVTLLGAYFSAGESQLFGWSVQEGMQELKLHMQYISHACPQTKYVLGGYSQGAMVLSKSLPNLDASKVLYVATFGDPKLYLPEGEPDPWNHFKTVDACRGVNLSPYRTYVPDCEAYEGVLGSVRPYQPATYVGKIGTWCNKSDIMCSSGFSVGDHTSYVAEDLYVDAAKYIRRKVMAAFPSKVPASSSDKDNRHDVAFLFDLTGSMSWTAQKYQAEAERLAGLVWAAGGRVALYGYRDLYYDSEPLKEFCTFSTCNAENFHAAIESMEFTGGGDESESVLSAAKIVMRSLSWRQGATKSLLLLTDAGYHSPDKDETTLNDVVALSLAIDPVNFYTLTSRSLMKRYTELTEATNGKAFDIDSEITLSTEMVFQRPVAKLSLPAYSGGIGEEFWFDASESYSLNGQALTFDWDLDGDGDFELMDAESKVRQVYDQAFDGIIRVRVNEGTKSSTMTASVEVMAAEPSENLAKLQITNAKLQNSTTATIEFVTENTEKVLLAVDDTILGFINPNEVGGQITIGDLPSNATITLVPYSATGRRGVADKVNLASDNAEALPTKPNTPSQNYPNSVGDNSNQPSSTSPSQIAPTIPKAPNTGVRQTAQTSK